MKCDVVLAYYNQREELVRALFGIKSNEKHIGKLILANDSVWDESEKEEIRREAQDLDISLEIVFTGHLHTTFGICKSFNEGVAQASTKYAFLTAADCYMPPGFLQQKLSKAVPGGMVCGPVHHVKVTEDTGFPLPEEPEFIRKDRFQFLAHDKEYYRAPWLYFRGANRLVDVAAFKRLGGFDERMDECNYEDFELTVRWATVEGRHLLVYDDTPIWHMNDKRGPNSVTSVFPYKSALILGESLSKAFGHRYNLYAHKTFIDPHSFNVPIDISLPFEYPEWIPDKSSSLITNHAINCVPFFHQHVSLLKTKLIDGGKLILSPMPAAGLKTLTDLGFVIQGYTEEDGTVEAIYEESEKNG